MRASEILNGAADKIAIGHAIGVRARNRSGTIVFPGDPEACCWCVFGAIEACSHDWIAGAQAVTYARVATGEESLSCWSDRSTQSQVVAALRKAAELAEAEGQ